MRKRSLYRRHGARHPDTLFIGMDSEPVCVVHAAQLVLDRGLKNAS